ncbi:retrovirus-related pol polyprotein from transposon TNT 1-94 [Tanacetum coccineum]
MKSVTKDHVKPTVLALGKYATDVEPIPPRNRNNREVHLDYLRHLKETVETLREIVEEAKVEIPLDRSIVSACRYTKHSQELLEYAIGTCPKDFNQQDKKHAPTPLIRKKQVTFEEQCDTSNSNTHKHVEQLNTQKTNVPVPPFTEVNCCTNASGSQPRSNTKKNRISPAKGVNKKKVEEHPRTNKSNLRTMNHVDSSSSSKRTVVQIVLWYLDSGCSKHMMGDRSWLRNFVNKFIGTIRFGNDHFGAIMGYGDYVIGDSVISRVYYVEGLGHNLLSIGQFCNSDLEVAFMKHSCYVRDMDGVKFIKGSRGSNLNTISVEDMMNSSPICLLSKSSKNKSWLWHRRLNHLNFGTINDLARKDFVRGLPRLKFEKVHLYSACQPGKNRVIYNKRNTRRTRKQSRSIRDERHGPPVQLSTGPAPTFLMPGQISSGLRRRTKLVSAAPSITPRARDRKTGDFIPTQMLHEYLELLVLKDGLSFSNSSMFITSAVTKPSSTTIHQDAPSPSHLPSSSALQSPSLHQGVAAESTLMENNPFAPVDNDPFINVFAPEPSFEASSSGNLSSAESPYVTQTL